MIPIRYFSKKILRSTTILCVKKDNITTLIGDGQVCLGHVRFKENAVKIRRISQNILCGFAGATADCLALLELLEKEYEKFPQQTLRVCISLAKQWRTNKQHRNLMCDMIVTDPNCMIMINGQGDAVEIDDKVVAIGSGGPYAHAAAKALLDIPGLSSRDIAFKAMNIAADMCVYTNKHFTCETIGI